MSKFKRPIQDYPTRRCHTMHECFRCKGTIHHGQDYFDGGYGYRAHVICPTRLGDERPDDPTPARATRGAGT